MAQAVDSAPVDAAMAPTAQARAGFRVSFVAGASIVLAVELLLQQALQRGDLDFADALAMHLAMAGSLAGLAFTLRHRPEIASLILQLALWTAIAGPIGSLLTIPLALLPPLSRDDRVDYGGWIEEQLRDVRLKRVYDLRRDIDERLHRISGASLTIPLVDVMIAGTREQKFDALALVGRRYHPAMAPALTLALADSDPSVRVLASTVKAKLLSALTKQLMTVRIATDESPGDPDAWIASAEAYRNLAASGLEEPARARQERQQAAAAMQCAVTFRPDDEALRLRLGEFLLDAGMNAATVSALTHGWIDSDLSQTASKLATTARLRMAIDPIAIPSPGIATPSHCATNGEATVRQAAAE